MKPRHAVALTALLVACGGGDAALGASNAQNPLYALDDGVLSGLFMVDGTEPRHGKPRQRFNEPQQGVTAVIRVGPLKAEGTLTVDWYQVNAWGGREHLFQHRIRVRADTFAWSVGVAQTHLAAGDYQVTASLGRDRLTTAWAVHSRADLPARRTTAKPRRPGRVARRGVGLVRQLEPANRSRRCGATPAACVQRVPGHQRVRDRL